MAATTTTGEITMKITTTMKTWMWTMLIAAVAVQTARATETPQPPAATHGDARSQVQVQVQADGVQVQADGDGSVVSKTIVIRVGPDGTVELKNALPAEVEEKVRRAQEATEKEAEEIKRRATQQAADVRARMGQMQGIQANGFGMQGSIMVIGPDGVKHTQTFGNAGGPVPDLRQLLEKSLEAAGTDLPDEIRQKLKQAFENQGQNQGQTQGQPDGGLPTGIAAEISRKLDRVLERLEKLEQDVKDLKAEKNPAER